MRLAPGFDEFVIERGGALLQLAYKLTGDRALAEDLVQESLLKAHRRWSRVISVERPEAYVKRILVNELEAWRRRRRNSETPSEVSDPPAGDDSDVVGEHDRMWRALAGLSARQRMVLVLRYYEGLSDREIAAILGCAESTVRSLAARSFEMLRSHPQFAPTGKEV